MNGTISNMNGHVLARHLHTHTHTHQPSSTILHHRQNGGKTIVEAEFLVHFFGSGTKRELTVLLSDSK